MKSVPSRHLYRLATLQDETCTIGPGLCGFEKGIKEALDGGRDDQEQAKLIDLQFHLHHHTSEKEDEDIPRQGKDSDQDFSSRDHKDSCFGSRHDDLTSSIRDSHLAFFERLSEGALPYHEIPL